MDNSEFKYRWQGIVSLNSLSPNGQFYYQISRPWDRHWGTFVAKISILNRQGDIIYYRRGTFAMPIMHESNNKLLRYVNFSSDGNFLFLTEGRIRGNSFRSVIINLKARIYTNFENITKLGLSTRLIVEDNFDSSILSSIPEKQWQPCIKNWRIKRNIFGMKKWYPRIK